MQKPVTLAIDTVRDRLQLGIARADGSFQTRSETLARGHAEIIIGRLDQLFVQAGCGYGDLERIAVLSGPGSFTGLRVGLATARGLGLALGVPVLGIPTLFALSLTMAGVGVVARDARREQAYVQRFSGPAEPEGPLVLMPAAHALRELGASAFPSDPVDLEAVLAFARDAEPAAFPPDPIYARPADAKPQTRGRVARL